MKWIGYISSAVVLNLLFFGIYLVLVGKFPADELGLAWRSIFESSPGPEEKPKADPPPEIPSYEDLLKERLLKSPEIARKIEELESVRRAVNQERASLEAARKDLGKLASDLEGRLVTAVDKARQEGEMKLLDLVSAMKPKQAKDVLISDTDKDRVLRLILKMDPASAEKIFREFKQPEDQRTLNGWLDRLGQGDPEATRLRKLMEQAKQIARK